jgi:nucleoside-diphosphate-sugar epimerase
MKRTLHFNIQTIILIILLFSLQYNIIISAQFPFKNIAALYKDIPVLVTGGCGFIGSHVAEKLVELGADVTILDNLSCSNEQNIATIADKITFIQGDIRNFETCRAATQNKKIIFHLAAFVSVPASIENPQYCHDVNVIGTQNMLEAARINNVKRFVFSSTCAIYGESSSQCTENMKPNPISPYGFSKLLGEIYCKEYAQLFDIETVAMRYFNVYGSRQNPQSNYAGVIAKFIHNMKYDLPLTIFGDGMQTRDYVPVEKVVEANILFGICKKDLIQEEIFNIATEKSMTIFDVIDMLKKNHPLYHNDIIHMPARPGDVQHVTANCSKYNNVYNAIINQITMTQHYE